ncbi:MAG: acyl-CoA dehydratase activase-related protein [Heliobacteriaceae bacterium]|jgi:predicted nucleotide-binding protein (sugar kinase/HSP70/actin superfamily)|nr:acyl-CoA dehydratase activase-related protein [Heliobacteriaceae bacterium]
MGTISIAWAAALQKLGIEAYVPPYTSKKTLSLGTKHSPEAICLPYKLILGNFIEAIEGGADYVAMISSPGICRLGEYGSCIKNALTDLGYDAKYIEMRLYDGVKGMYRFAQETTGKNAPVLFLRAIIHVIRMVFLLDDLDARLNYLRAREVNPGEAEKNFNKALELIKEGRTPSLKKLKKEAFAILNRTETDKTREVLHVDLTGEIYIVNDAFSNQNIVAELGKMGVHVRRSLTVSSFLKDAIIPEIFRKGETHLQRAFRMAKPYLMRDIGGDALECVSDVAYADARGIDGLVHVSPFTCMPEIMSQNIFPKMREDLDIPILPLIMDEQTGKAGYLTRLEAFVDLMKRRKRKMKQCK